MSNSHETLLTNNSNFKENETMRNVLDINDQNLMSVEDVVAQMYEYTSDDGKLYVTVFNDEGYVKVNGYYECEMLMDEWAADHDKVADTINSMCKTIKENIGLDYDELVDLVAPDLEDNYFYSFACARIPRIARLIELGAPSVIVDSEVKAFAYYYTLNKYCDTL